MATTATANQQLLIGGEWRGASSGREYEQTFPFTGETVGVAAAGGREDARAAVEAAQAAFGEWSTSAPAMRREILSKAADLLMERQEEIARTVTEETGGVFGWGMFNVMLAAGMLREAAAQAYGLVGEVIPSDVPGKAGDGRPGTGGRDRRHRPVERAGDPVHAGGRNTTGIREYRRPQGIGDLPTHPRCRDPRTGGCRPPAGSDKPDHQRPSRRTRCGR